MEHDELVETLATQLTEMLTVDWSAMGATVLGSIVSVLRFLSGLDMVLLLLHADVVPATDTIVMLALLAALGIVWTIRHRRRQARFAANA